MGTNIDSTIKVIWFSESLKSFLFNHVEPIEIKKKNAFSRKKTGLDYLSISKDSHSSCYFLAALLHCRTSKEVNRVVHIKGDYSRLQVNQ